MYKVGVIGLGSIAAMYETPASKLPYCHVGGILQSGNVHLVKVADMADIARDKFREVWGPVFPDVRYYNDGASMLASGDLDIVAVCVRGPHHYKVMLEVLDAKPKAVFLEKPPTCSLQEMDQMMQLATKNEIPITVSYSRHWATHILRFQQLVREGLIGEVKTVIGYCGGEILSYASHTTDLICQFAGYEPVSVYARGTVPGSDSIPAGYEPEPRLDNMVIHFANGVTGIQVGSSGEYGQFYCDVFGTKGSLRIGMYIPTVLKNAKGEAQDLVSYELPEPASVFRVAYDQIAAHLDGGPLPDCSNENFVIVNEVGFAAIESLHSGKTVALPNSSRGRKVFANA